MSEEVCSKEGLTTELDTLKAVYLTDLVVEEDEDSLKCGEIATTPIVAIDEGGDHLKQNDVIAYSSKFTVNLLPNTADAKAEQFVALSVRFQIPLKYPDELPIIELKGPRGLSDEKVDKIKNGLKDIAEKNKGNNMLYELIDFVKESLTAFNFPSGQCVICLYDFTKEDVFTKTDCFHHFHCRCLADYTKSNSTEPIESEEKAMKSDALLCPVCREKSNLLDLLKEPYDDYPPPSLSQKPITGEKNILLEARLNQEKFAELFKKQNKQGGIIDEEKDNVVLKISGTSTNSSNVKADVNTSEETTTQCDKTIDLKDSPNKSKSTNDSSSESSNVNILADVSHSSVSSAEPKGDSNGASKEAEQDGSHKVVPAENGNAAVSPTDETSTSTGKENVKPEHPKRQKPRRKSNQNRTKSNETAQNGHPRTDSESQDQQPQQQQQQQQSQQRGSRQRRNSQNQGYRQNYRYNRRRSQGTYQRNEQVSPPYHNYRGNYNHYGGDQSDNRYRQNGYADYNNRFDMQRDRPGYYAARIFRQKHFSRPPKPDEHNQEASHANAAASNASTSNAVSDQASRKDTNTRSRQSNTRNSENSDRNRRNNPRRYSTDDGTYQNVNVQVPQPKNRQFNYYYRQPQSYNQRFYYDYNHMNRYSNYNHYDNYGRYFDYVPERVSSRDMYYNNYNGGGVDNRGYTRRRRNSNRRRRNDTQQSQTSTQAETTNKRNSSPTPVSPTRETVP